MKRAIFLAAVAALAAGCSSGQSRSNDETFSREVEDKVREADARAGESRTLSALSKLEEALAAYIAAERKIPDKLEELMPRYLADIPPLELDVRGHRDTNAVQVYPPSILRDGQIDGTRLKDTGRWGYTHNDRQVVVFIDCTHQSKRGHAWYKQKGVY